MLKGRWTARMLLTFVIACAIPAGTAHAVPGERAAAEAFADAAYAYTKESWEAKPAIRAALDATAADRSLCLQLRPTLLRMVKASASGPEVSQLLAVLFYRPYVPVVRQLLPVYDRFLVRLDGVRNPGSILRAGRATWRSEAEFSRAVVAIPEDACARLRAWDRGGRPGIPLPEVDLTELRESLQAEGPDDEERARDRAAERLRQLGQGPRRAARFTGIAANRALDAFSPDLERDVLWLLDIIFDEDE
ncbi:MAG: hypothetical protein JHC95_06455 [Solirubrobacteraceae bacterium]|nr:hypothetical protein [Solirubrobacteraceae bacterium]